MAKISQLGLSCATCFICKKKMNSDEEVLRISRDTGIIYLCCSKKVHQSSNEENENIGRVGNLRCIYQYAKAIEKKGNFLILTTPLHPYLVDHKISNAGTINSICSISE